MADIIRPIQSLCTSRKGRKIRRTISLRSMAPCGKSNGSTNRSQHMRRHARRNIRILKTLIRYCNRHRDGSRNSQRASRCRSTDSAGQVRRTLIARRNSMLIRSSRIRIRQNARITKYSINRQRHRKKSRESRRGCTRSSHRQRYGSPYGWYLTTTGKTTNSLLLHLHILSRYYVS